MSKDKVTPTTKEVVDSAKVILAVNPSLGIAKLLVQLQQANHWSLSEKRLKGILVDNNLRQKPSSSQLIKKTPSYIPDSHIDTSLAIPSNIRAVYFDDVKGKGLVAERSFKTGETIFEESAYISAPPQIAIESVFQGQLCFHCCIFVLVCVSWIIHNSHRTRGYVQYGERRRFIHGGSCPLAQGGSCFR